MTNRVAVDADALRRAARRWINANSREVAVLAAQSESLDPGADHHWMAIGRVTRAKIKARSALIRAVPTIPALVNLGDMLVVVAPGEQAERRPGRRWKADDLVVLALPGSAVL